MIQQFYFCVLLKEPEAGSKESVYHCFIAALFTIAEKSNYHAYEWINKCSVYIMGINSALKNSNIC